ncbi:putative protein phosphatase 2C 6 [Vitis vinifera]|uniref:PPM-type phosphatase domain-containing protein n=1 Tax=Vitis vinifera TaxID=29760 RepID=A0A438GX33_VITVI|nr:putative protein phosphatase 2C 6 [Vitis vinifera]
MLVSCYCARMLHEMVAEEWERGGGDEWSKRWELHYIIAANCGDSRAVLCRGTQAIPLTVDHKIEVTIPYENLICNYKPRRLILLSQPCSQYLARSAKTLATQKLKKLGRQLLKEWKLFLTQEAFTSAWMLTCLLDRQDELARIEEAGGQILYWQGPRVEGVLSMTRAIEMRLVDDVWTHQPRPQKNYRGLIASVLPCKIEDILHIRKLLRVHQKRSKGKIQAKSKSKPQIQTSAYFCVKELIIITQSLHWGFIKVLCEGCAVNGDHYLKPWIISEPEVAFTTRSDEDECLILASDGLWDVLSNEQVVKVARNSLREERRKALLNDSSLPPAHSAADSLLCCALAEYSDDNISIIVGWFFWVERGLELLGRAANPVRHGHLLLVLPIAHVTEYLDLYKYQEHLSIEGSTCSDSNFYEGLDWQASK